VRFGPDIETLPAFREIQSNSPAYAMLNATPANASAVAAPSRVGSNGQ
jgi:hypothetical protein